MKPRGDGGAADGKMPAQLGSCAGIAFPSGPSDGHNEHVRDGKDVDGCDVGSSRQDGGSIRSLSRAT